MSESAKYGLYGEKATLTVWLNSGTVAARAELSRLLLTADAF